MTAKFFKLELILNKNIFTRNTFHVKVSKSQKHFFLKLHCPKNERNI